jgi:hypothetical protein
MAVEPDATRLNPPVNTVGGPPPNKPPSGQVGLSSDTRNLGKYMTVWPPDGGVPEDHLTFNARDLVRHHGWSEEDPKGKKKKKKEDIEDNDDETSDTAVTETYDDEILSAANKNLQAHRDALNALGVEPKKTWGLKRLKEEILAKGGIIPE